MNRQLATIGLALVIVLSACSNATSPTAEPTSGGPTQTTSPTAAPSEALDPIKVGFYGPLTGPVSKAGQALFQGAELRFKEANAAGGVLGRQIEFISCDDKSTPEEAVKCAQKLITQDGVLVNVGSLHSAHLMATGPILEENKVPTVAAGTSPTWCNSGFNYLWRATANANANTEAIAAGIGSASLKKMAILYQNDDYGQSGADSLKGALSGLAVVAEEAYTLGDKDWSGQIIKMLAGSPDIMGVWGLGEDMGPIFNQMRSQGWTGPIVAAEGASYPDLPEIAGDNLNGVIFASLYYVPEVIEAYPDAAIRDYLTKYVAAFGALPEDDNAYRGYDAASVLIEGITQAGDLDPEKIRDAINGMSAFAGLAGSFDYKTGGCEGINNSRLWEYVDRKVVPFDGL